MDQTASPTPSNFLRLKQACAHCRVALTVCAVLITLLIGVGLYVYPAILVAREVAFRSETRNGIKMTIHEAFLNSPMTFRGPAAPIDMLKGIDANSNPAKVSWRLHGLSTTQVFGNAWSKSLCTKCSWDSDENRRFISMNTRPWFVKRPGSNAPGIMAITGKGSAFDEMIKDWRDLPKDCIVAVEVFRDDLTWTQPIDIEISTGDWKHQSGLDTACAANVRTFFAVCFADCVVYDIRCDVPERTILSLMLVESAKTLHREVVLEPYRTRH